jgi:electron transfer flavoprotein alpha subunit
VVFAEFGGEKLLGKAREVADSLGLRVLAVCSSEHGTDEFAQRLISLGADEVMKYRSPANVFEWSEALSSLLKSQVQTKFLFAARGLITDAILGRFYALSKDQIASFGTGIDSLSENEAAKNLRSWGASLRFTVNDHDKAHIFSFKSGSVPEPFEDTSRYGKISEAKAKSSASGKSSPKTVGLQREDYCDSSGILTLLLGETYARKETGLRAAQRVASKYKGNIVIKSSKVEDIFGPCLAIDVEARHESELPRFHEDLIAINSSEDQAISRMADISAITEDIPKVLEEL